MDVLDADLLRTFLAFVDTGSLARAAETVGRSPSAVTAQMQRLEEVVGVALIEPSGRGRVVSRSGEELAGHARRILDAHHRALLAVKGTLAAGRLRLGTTQDAAEAGLSRILRLFAETHPQVRLDLRVERSSELVARFDAGEIDVLLVLRDRASPNEIGILVEPMIWLVSVDGLFRQSDDLPLALLDGPCEFRNAAVSALDAARMPYSIAATSQSLSGIRAAVAAGLAVTLRTLRWAGPEIVPAPASLRLPSVGNATFAIRIASQAPDFANDLARLLHRRLWSPHGRTADADASMQEERVGAL